MRVRLEEMGGTLNTHRELRKAIRNVLRTEIEKSAKDSQSEAQLVGTIPCKDGQEIRIRWTHYLGERRLDMRLYVLNQAAT